MKLTTGTVLRAKSILFDMDGTLVDSTAVIQRVWSRWADRHALSRDEVLHTIHGVRITDSVKTLAPEGTDIDAEIAALIAEERAEVAGLAPVPGAVDLLSKLPHTAWAVVTSADRALAEKRMAFAGIPTPPVLIAAEDVTRGKPDPDGFLKAANELSAPPAASIVFEDSSAGLEAGRRAGCRTVAVTATLRAPTPPQEEWIEDFSNLLVSLDETTHEIVLSVAS